MRNWIRWPVSWFQVLGYVGWGTCDWSMVSGRGCLCKWEMLTTLLKMISIVASILWSVFDPLGCKVSCPNVLTLNYLSQHICAFVTCIHVFFICQRSQKTGSPWHSTNILWKFPCWSAAYKKLLLIIIIIIKNNNNIQAFPFNMGLEWRCTPGNIEQILQLATNLASII